MPPVLFVNIGWAERYDGTEDVHGNHRWLREHAGDNSEMRAFTPMGEDRRFWCGIGRGQLSAREVDIVFVALEPLSHEHRAVGIYRHAQWEPDDEASNPWVRAWTKDAALIPATNRPSIAWPGKMSMRRWADRGGGDSPGREWPDLYKSYIAICGQLVPGATEFRLPEEVPDQHFVDGAHRRVITNDYERDPHARRACIAHFGWRCRICGTDLGERYGPVAARFVHVHHITALAHGRGPTEIDPTRDLIPVCPNCHAIIHRRDPPYTPEDVRAMLRRR